MATDGPSRPNSYTEAERKHALELYVEHGPAAAEQQCGIASATIRKWAERRGVTRDRSDRARKATDAARLSWAQRRAEVCERAGEVAANLLERADTSAKSRDVSNLMRGFAVAVDKAQLLDGAPTGRVVSQVERVARVQEIRDELAARRVA